MILFLQLNILILLVPQNLQFYNHQLLYSQFFYNFIQLYIVTIIINLWDPTE